MGLGDFISGVFGSKNKEAEKVDPYQTDPNAYQYGGHAGGAQAQADQYGGTAGNYTQGAYQNFTNAAGNFGAAGDDRNAAYAARGQQQDALGLMAARAHGQDLISSQITAQQQQQAAAQQAGMAASARGPAALAMAQQNAAANTGQATAQLGAQGAIAGAQEKLANEQAYLGGASGIRGQDIGQMGATTALGSAQGGMAAQQGQLGLGYSGLQNNVQQSQLAASMNQQAQNSANYNAAKGIQAGAAGQNAQTNQQNALGLVGALASGGAGFAAGTKAHGGPTRGGQPYLVGEEAPELIIPKKDGWVLTAQQTAALLGAPPTRQQVAAMPALGGLSHALCNGGSMYARADGGPIYNPASGQSVPGPSEPLPAPAPATWGASLPPPAAPPTWGTQSVGQAEADRAKQAVATLDARNEADDAAAIQQMRDYQYGGEASKKIEARDKSRVAAYDRNRSLGLYDNVQQTPDEAADERRARYSVGAGAKVEAKQQKTAEADAKKEGGRAKAALGSIGGGFTDMAKHVNTGYQPAATYAAPTLLALPSYGMRAAGGPITGGGMTDPGGASAGELGMGGVGGLVQANIGHENRDIAGAMHPMSGGGGGLSHALGGFGSSLTNLASGIDTSYHPILEAREEGGPISTAAHRAADVAAKMGTPVQLSTAPQTVAMAADLARRTHAAQGNEAGAAAVQRMTASPPPVGLGGVLAFLRSRQGADLAPLPAAVARGGAAPTGYIREGEAPEVVVAKPEEDRVVEEEMPSGPYARARGGPISGLARAMRGHR